jgi:hypothetical protein
MNRAVRPAVTVGITMVEPEDGEHVCSCFVGGHHDVVVDVGVSSVVLGVV